MNRNEGRISSAIHTVVFHNPTQWAAVPANNGGNGPIWQWGNELLVGFTVGTFARTDRGHQCADDKPFDSWLARSRNGGESWQAYTPTGYQGQQGFRMENAVPLPAAVDFTSPGFVMRVEGDGYHGNGGRQWFHSQDKGMTWQGPYTFGALLDHPELAGRNLTARTAYIVNGPRDCFLFLSAGPAFADKVFLARTADGGKSFRFVSWVVPPTDPFRAVMPAPVRLSTERMVVAIRRRTASDDPCWIDCYQSSDNGETWTFLSKVGETGRENGNPPALVGLPDGRLCCVYGNRDRRVMIACFSTDAGRTWGPERVLRDGLQSVNGFADLGYPRLFQRPDGKLVAVYFWCTPERPETHIEATIFEP